MVVMGYFVVTMFSHSNGSFLDESDTQFSNSSIEEMQPEGTMNYCFDLTGDFGRENFT